MAGLVADASALVDLLLGRAAVDRFVDDLARVEHLDVPEIADIEVLQALRRWHRRGAVDRERAGLAVRRLEQLPLVCHSHRDLREEVWALRDRCSAYDATYVALARALDAPLMTTDARLATAASGLVKVL